MDWLNESKENWHQWRGKGLGSSDMPVIMGVSPWKNIDQLYLEKTDQGGGKFEGNWATRRGQELEPIAREMYEKKMGSLYPATNMEHLQYPWARASFDGLNHIDRRVLEIKCPGKDSHQKAMIGEIPAVYYPQVQWLLFVSGYEELDYVSWDGKSEDFALVRVKPDPTYQQIMFDKALAFWTRIQEGKPLVVTPPVERLDLTALLNQRFELKAQIDSLTMAYEMVNNQIRELAPTDCVCGDYKIKWSEAKGLVDYSKIPVLNGLDLEIYRKPPSKRMLITK